MSATLPSPRAIVEARMREDVIVGDVVIRHRLASRVIHWCVALFFFVCLLSGLPIWTPVFSWLAPLFGSLSVCRVIHPWAGLLFTASSLAMFVRWLGEMKLTAHDRAWLDPRQVIRYMTHESHDPEVGKYNGGQKMFFFTAAAGALGLLVSGVVLWLPMRFPMAVRLGGILLHDATFILFAIAIVAHIYMGTTALPGTFQAMVRGTVSRAWARAHHPRWYRDVVGRSPLS